MHWLYEPGALTLSARYQQGQLYYVVSDHQGTVREILTEEGELIWAGRLLTWGEPEFWRVLTLNDPRNLTCNLLFCGQYADSESGLCYNRFRYYDNETGQYLSTDPLNLSGGFNPYGYVHDPVNWIDPFGLAGCSTKLGKNMMEDMGLPRSTKWSGYQAHHVIPKQYANHPALKKIKYDIDNSTNGIFLREVDDGVSAMARHQGNHNGYSRAIKNALDKIDLNQSVNEISKQVADIQNLAKKGMMNGTPIRAKDISKGKTKIGNQRALEMWNKILGV
ncbi:hypothetical protein CE143_16100 [Photorhabdus luminescens]|uniref:RHS repeat-associated core domain-containing protein n=1 Tax=Photorhabdus akhurstii TaxID=171438 RepID=A0ABX8LYV0_9GAMM|nr:AHH domain-containing protein [Photorhabdus akhurstii]QXF34504.1 hypothetical protein B0X70_16110 [Photorhabdus akhurstii]UJD76329.1 hypothetical protein CE143_16100 [Photorhabdus luminescens]